jgi:hypothetical protein
MAVGTPATARMPASSGKPTAAKVGTGWVASGSGYSNNSNDAIAKQGNQ